MGLMDTLRSKYELYRLEQRYTRREKRTTFTSGAVYVDGEYVYRNGPPPLSPSEGPSPYASSSSSTATTTTPTNTTTITGAWATTPRTTLSSTTAAGAAAAVADTGRASGIVSGFPSPRGDGPGSPISFAGSDSAKGPWGR